MATAELRRALGALRSKVEATAGPPAAQRAPCSPFMVGMRRYDSEAAIAAALRKLDEFDAWRAENPRPPPTPSDLAREAHWARIEAIIGRRPDDPSRIESRARWANPRARLVVQLAALRGYPITYAEGAAAVEEARRMRSDKPLADRIIATVRRADRDVRSKGCGENTTLCPPGFLNAPCPEHGSQSGAILWSLPGARR